MKFDLVLKPRVNIAFVTDSPSSIAFCAAAIRALLMKRDTLRANKRETIEWLKFTLEGVGE